MVANMRSEPSAARLFASFLIVDDLELQTDTAATAAIGLFERRVGMRNTAAVETLLRRNCFNCAAIQAA